MKGQVRKTMDEIDKAIVFAAKKNMLRVGLIDVDTGDIIPWENKKIQS